MTTEFDIIKKYFTQATSNTDLGIGDDAALISTAAGHQLAVSTDSSVVGTHFFSHAEPYDIGWKSLAVNISDMAAMGATPKWATLALTLPKVSEYWLKEFSRGFFACAKNFHIDLIGGDTTKGPLNIGVQIIGEVPNGKSLKRSGAEENQDIWVSGTLGSAALALASINNPQFLLEDKTLFACLKALNTPLPRVTLGTALREVATSCIDISDGLLADLAHILTASSSEDKKLGAIIQLEAIPCIPTIKQWLSEEIVRKALLAGGDDYELCFTASRDRREAILWLAQKMKLPLTHIGRVNATGKLAVLHENKPVNISTLGYDHFA